MKLQWISDLDVLASLAADRICALVRTKPTALIALPTGQTPILLYRELAHRQAKEPGLMSRARFINLDEFVGCAVDHPQSYGHFLHQHFFGPLKIAPDRIRLLQGDAEPIAAECRAVDAFIEDHGGIDLAILGLGRNGHIAFNEPGTDWDLTTHVADLALATRQAQSGLYADPADVPVKGLTLGIATLRAARSVLLLISGDHKEAALEALTAGQPSLNWPVTALLDHPDLGVLAQERRPAA